VADLGGDDLGNAAAATKAVATGDPRYVEQVSLEDDVKRLSAMARAHSDAKARNAAERRSGAREVTACEEQMVELDRALPALAANSSAPFAMNVRGKTYRERAEAAPVLVDSLRQAYVEGKRYGNTKEFPIAELRGVQVTASRMLSSDEMIVTLSVPGRSRSIQAKDLTGRDTASVGLVRRVENMVADTPHYREELNRRHEHALTRIAELEAVADEPFEHTDTLRDKRHRLDTLTAALQTSADSPEAKAKETEHQQRMAAQGREPGWSLALNPTPALRAEFGDEELARRAGHGGGGSDTRGLVGAGVGAGPGDLAVGQGSGCAACGPVGLSGSGQSEHRADRAGGGCAGTPSHPTAARGVPIGKLTQLSAESASASVCNSLDKASIQLTANSRDSALGTPWTLLGGGDPCPSAPMPSGGLLPVPFKAPQRQSSPGGSTGNAQVQVTACRRVAIGVCGGGSLGPCGTRNGSTSRARWHW